MKSIFLIFFLSSSLFANIEHFVIFFNSFEYQNSSDILYFLLATCQNIKMNIDKVNLNYILNLKVEDLIKNTKNFYSKFNVVYDSSIDKQDYIYS